MELGIILWMIGLTGMTCLAVRWSSRALDELDDLRKKVRNRNDRPSEGRSLKHTFKD